MSFWTAIVAIVAISAICGSLTQIIKQNGGKSQAKVVVKLETRIAQLEQNNELLAQRVEVLEKIVTDGNYELEQEFRKLG